MTPAPGHRTESAGAGSRGSRPIAHFSEILQLTTSGMVAASRIVSLAGRGLTRLAVDIDVDVDIGASARRPGQPALAAHPAVTRNTDQRRAWRAGSRPRSRRWAAR